MVTHHVRPLVLAKNVYLKPKRGKLIDMDEQALFQLGRPEGYKTLGLLMSNQRIGEEELRYAGPTPLNSRFLMFAI
jgi:hypothetical protein